MKSILKFSLPVLSALLLLNGCAGSAAHSGTDTASSSAAYAEIDYDQLIGIELSDDKILVNG